MDEIKNIEQDLNSIKEIMIEVSGVMEEFGNNISNAMAEAQGATSGTTIAQQLLSSSSLALTGISLTLNAALAAQRAEQAALNIVQLASPMGWIAVALAACVAGYQLLNGAVSESTNAHQSAMDAINSEITARNDLRTKQQEQLEANLAEINNVGSLNTELLSLVDSEGRVTAGNQERAEFIVSVLNKALGEQISIEDGVLTGYGDSATAINDKIALLKAEAVLEAQLPAYKEALINATNAQIEADRLESELSDLKMQKQAKEAELVAKYGANWKESFAGQHSLLAQELKDIENSTTMKEEEFNKQNELTQGYYDDISLYETNAALIASGNAENYGKVQMESAVTKATTVEEKKVALQTEIEAETAQMEYLQELKNAETDVDKQRQIQAQIDSQQLKIDGYQSELDGIAEQGELVAEAKNINSTSELDLLGSHISEKQAKLLEMYETDATQMTDAQRNEARILKESFDGDLSTYNKYTEDKVSKAVDLTNKLTANSTQQEIDAALAAQREAQDTLAIMSSNVGDKMSVLEDLKRRRQNNDATVTDNMISEAERQASMAKTEYEKVAEKTITAMKDKETEVPAIGKNYTDGFVKGANSLSYKATEAGTSLGGSFMTALRNAGLVKSPSKKTKEIGNFYGEGFTMGMLESQKDVENSAGDLAQSALDEFSDFDIRFKEAFENINIHDIFGKIKNSIANENAKLSNVINGSILNDTRLNSKVEIEMPEIKGTIKGNIENHLEIDGRETAIQLTPFISEELAFSSR